MKKNPGKMSCVFFTAQLPNTLFFSGQNIIQNFEGNNNNISIKYKGINNNITKDE